MQGGYFDRVWTAGITPHEDKRLDVTKLKDVYAFLRKEEVDHVVCTVGTNMPGTIQGAEWHRNMKLQMLVNYQGPMNLLAEWARYWRDKEDATGPELNRHFVVVSSNSAHTARSESGGYCASKAALSMGVRCAARQQAHRNLSIYGYEPGWMDGTPMSEGVEERLGTGAVVHRIPGNNTMDPFVLAKMIVTNMVFTCGELNGTMLRVDGGEQ